MAANTDTTITLMAFEGGALINALSDKPQGAALARKVEDADQDALAAGKVEFEMSFNPIEVGMAFEAVSRSESLLSQALSDKLRVALKAKLDELGVSYGNAPTSQPSLGEEPASDAEPTWTEGEGEGEQSSESEQDSL